MSLKWLSSHVLSLFCLLALTGCGGGTAPELGSVSGTVTQGGSPLSNALVTFYPEKGRPSMGTTDENGYYTLDYTSEARGALIGSHTVKITSQVEDGEMAAESGQKEAIPAKYNEQSELTAVVEAGSNTHDFPLD